MKIFYVSLLLLFGCFSLSAQESVHLKNGKTVSGKVNVKTFDKETVKVKTQNGEKLEFHESDIAYLEEDGEKTYPLHYKNLKESKDYFDYLHLLEDGRVKLFLNTNVAVYVNEGFGGIPVVGSNNYAELILVDEEHGAKLFKSLGSLGPNKNKQEETLLKYLHGNAEVRKYIKGHSKMFKNANNFDKRIDPIREAVKIYNQQSVED